MTIEVSVVIPILDEADRLARQVEAVIAQLSGDVELILVDNGSTDASPRLIAEYADAHPRVRSLREPDRGINRARNAGVAAARGRLILLCDADDVVQPGWIEGLRSALATADLAGGVVHAVDADDAPTTVHDPHDYTLWGFSSPWGSCCGFRREIWERVGGFDPRMSGGFDEMDFFLRAQLTGATLAWTDDARVRYLWRRSPAIARRRRFEGQFRSCRVYWAGRVQGRPRSGRLVRDLGFLVSRAPLAPFSATIRAAWARVAMRRVARLGGFVRYGLPEIWRAATAR